MFSSMGTQDLGGLFQQLGRFLSYEGGPVNWDLARDMARQTVVAQKDRSITDGERAAVRDAVRLAELWLDGATTLPSTSAEAEAWSRAEWVEATLPVWRQLCDPVASRVVSAMGEAVPAEMRQLGPLLGVMQQVGGAMFGAQVGQAIGELSGEVVGSADVGVPLTATGRPALMPAAVASFGEGLGIPADEVRLYLALREAAHQRLFTHVPWLRSHLLGTVEAYARGIRVDNSRIEEAMRDLDPSNPQVLQEALTAGMFEPETTPEQQVALARLETALALVEGWVDEVVDQAATGHLPSASALRESVRRRRATGGPAEQTFATLVGLELRPRRMREGAALWAALLADRGVDGRDAVWAHPDLLPTSEDLDDPSAYVSRSGELDLSGLDELPPTPDEDRPDDPQT
ncbi:MAG TPA: zinc-dependent metalloprotease [Actinomycetes bacterium]|nr:zinc-dependent metalloprotease [Actinomycetes bacterium]